MAGSLHRPRLREAKGSLGIRILIVVLALTASRNNFPFQTGGTTVRVHGFPGEDVVPRPSKHDDVVPSRRLLEIRRSDWIKILVSPSPGAPTLLCAPEVPAPARPPTERLALHRRSKPRYLRLDLDDLSQSSLPPPARA